MARAFVMAALLAACAHAAVPNAMLRAVPALPPITAEEGLRTTPNGTTVPSLNTVYIFDQLIDHTNPSLGTFKQRYWMDWEYYKPGGPIIFMTPGEANAQNYTGYLTNSTINGLIAQQQNGATVLIEHRFFGLSNPYPNLSSQSLAFLTIQQAIDDLVYFAQQANLPMPGGDNVKPNTTPWILIGGSYSGAFGFHTSHGSEAEVASRCTDGLDNGQPTWDLLCRIFVVRRRRSHHELLGIL